MRRALVGLAGAFSLACATRSLPPPADAARVELEVARGMLASSAPTPRVAVIVDASESMREAAARGISRWEAARAETLDLLETLPPDFGVSVDVLGGTGSESCAEPRRVLDARPRAASTAGALADVTPGGDASLARALDVTREKLAGELAADGARVVVLTDLDDGCGGDVCEAASSLLAAGASLDVVVFGARKAPECLSSVRVGSAPAIPEPPSVRFQVVPATGRPVEGVAGGDAVLVPPGTVRIRVALVPPLEIGPLALRPGDAVRIRVLDFPNARPPVREWSIGAAP